MKIVLASTAALLSLVLAVAACGDDADPPKGQESSVAAKGTDGGAIDGAAGHATAEAPGPGAKCDLPETAKAVVTSVTKTSGEPRCPSPTVEALNASIREGEDGDPACMPSVDTSACTMAWSCTTFEEKGVATNSGKMAKVGTVLEGTFEITFTPDEGEELKCAYRMTMSIQ